ncbi:2-isopropylmalate synthase [Methanolobus zinderi]|uniref:Probable 2-isopropylmalate synthase n=1 Tax=Methanolobus zinderi TaxID=536044 RepID=A0A7D5E9U4_9EURY|nr:2-isopropylmalate synthase [Methanolobus zinderi]QLC51171.1 2-isopropylmalate synthase [Methanolobus zinderi]
MNKRKTIFDTTLRDGEQTPGVSLTNEQKLKIARQLDKLGVDVLEAGFPISSQGEKQNVRAIASEGLTLDVCGLARVLPKDLDACIDCGVDMVHTFVSTSDIQRIHTIKKSREEVVTMAVDAVERIKEHGVKCMFSAMDATRTDLDYLTEIFRAVEGAGCDIINVPDTVGVMSPSRMYNLVNSIYKEVNIPIDVHCHNDFGIAVANSLMAVEAGASQVQCTVNGIGERAGNANLAQVVMSLHSIYGAKTNINTEYLLETSKMVENFTGIRSPPNTPIVGDNAFAHESGIHTHGVLEQSDTFEPGIMTPEMVGHKRRIVVGKHAGKHAVKKSLDDMGIETTEEQLDEILVRIKDIANKGKRICDADLHAVASAVLGRNLGQETIILKEFSVMTGNLTTPTAVVRATVGDEEAVASNFGVGPIDAALKAVEEMMGGYTKIKVRDFSLEAITGGSDALAEVTISVEDEDGRVVSAQSASADIATASVDALITAINILLEKKKLWTMQ